MTENGYAEFRGRMTASNPLAAADLQFTMRLLVNILAMSFVSQLAYANCQPASEFIRECFDNSNAPPALLYQNFVQSLFADILEDEEHRDGQRIVEAGLTPNMSADDAIYYFASRYLDIEKEVEDAQKRTLCIDSNPRYAGAENFIIFGQWDEIRLNVYEKHLFFARSDLLASGLFDLDKALEEQPGSFTAVITDHEKAFGGSTKRIYELATTLCAKPWIHRFGTERSVDIDPLVPNTE